MAKVEGSECPSESSAAATTAVAEPFTVVKRDYGFLPIPPHLRRESANHTFKFGLMLNIMFGFASTFTVANIYYCQPLLVKMAYDFGITYSEISRVPTLVQAGYGTGLILISPMGDLVRRRPLLLLVVFLAASLTIGLAVTKSFVVFEALTFLVGAFTVTPQILLPLASDLAPPQKRATAISIVLSGLLLGVLTARVIAGIIAQYASWRIVYYMAIGVQFMVFFMLYLMVPDCVAKNTHLRYIDILRSMVKFAVTEPALIQALSIMFLSAACFTNFWVTLTFLLNGPPYHYSTLVIGLFGLIGIGGVSAAPFTGNLIDHMVPWCSTLITSFGLICSAAIQTGASGINIGAVVLGCIFADLFRQMQQISITSSVLGIEPSASARMNAVLVFFIFIGQVMGTSVSTQVFIKNGWRASAALQLGWTGLQLIFLLLRGPHCNRYTWFGYENGCELRKQKALEKKRMREEGIKAVVKGDVELGSSTEGEKLESGEVTKIEDEVPEIIDEAAR